MGIYCKLFQITDAEAERIRAHPEAISSFIEAKATAHPLPYRRGRLDTFLKLPAPTSPAIWVVDLDKMWDALDFLLNGRGSSAGSPLSITIHGGQLVKRRGQGDIKLLGKAEVPAVAEALTALTHDELDRRFDPARFAAADIYPGAWDEDRQELLSELLDDFDQLVAIYRDAASCGNSVLIDIG